MLVPRTVFSTAYRHCKSFETRGSFLLEVYRTRYQVASTSTVCQQYTPNYHCHRAPQPRNTITLAPRDCSVFPLCLTEGHASLVHCTRPSTHNTGQTVHEYARHNVCLKATGSLSGMREHQPRDSNPVLVGVCSKLKCNIYLCTGVLNTPQHLKRCICTRNGRVGCLLYSYCCENSSCCSGRL